MSLPKAFIMDNRRDKSGGAEETVQETHDKHVLHAETPCGFGYFTGFLLSQERRMLVFLHSLLRRNPVKPMLLSKPNCHFQLSIINFPLSTVR